MTPIVFQFLRPRIRLDGLTDGGWEEKLHFLQGPFAYIHLGSQYHLSQVNSLNGISPRRHLHVELSETIGSNGGPKRRIQ